MPLLLALLAVIIPPAAIGVGALMAEKGLTKEAAKRQWVDAFANDLQPFLNKWLPADLLPLEADIVIAIEAALNEALDKAEGANSADTQSTAPVPTPSVTTVSDSGGSSVPVTDSSGAPVPVKPSGNGN